MDREASEQIRQKYMAKVSGDDKSAEAKPEEEEAAGPPPVPPPLPLVNRKTTQCGVSVDEGGLVSDFMCAASDQA